MTYRIVKHTKRNGEAYYTIQEKRWIFWRTLRETEPAMYGVFISLQFTRAEYALEYVTELRDAEVVDMEVVE